MPCALSVFTMSRMLRRLCGSMPPVGSSMNTTCGLCNSATAMLMRRFMPPEYFSMRWSARSRRPTVSSSSATRRFRSAPPSPYICPQKVQVLARAQGGVKRNILRHNADGALGLRRGFAESVAGDDGVAASGRQQGGEHGDGGGFACAVGAEQAEGLTLENAEADAFDGGLRPVVRRRHSINSGFMDATLNG